MNGRPDTRLAVTESADGVMLRLSGRLDAAGAGRLWRSALAAARRQSGRALTVDAGAVSYCDMSGAAFLAAIEATHSGHTEIRGLGDSAAALLERARAARRDSVATPRHRAGGSVLARAGDSLAGGIAFLGQVAYACMRLPRRRRMLRIPDLLRHIEQAGTRSLPLVILLGYLMGLILAFQSAIPMRRFGAELFVANLVSISLLRELGPLLAAVIRPAVRRRRSPPRSAR
jgi:phospholipid/cholesterol/gamma-HCH transport system permease protein